MLFIDALATSGSGAAIEILLEKIKSKTISPTRAASILMTFNNVLVQPGVIPDLIVSSINVKITNHRIDNAV